MPVVTCIQCNRSIPEEAESCPHCGASKPSGAVSAMILDARQALNSNPDDTAARYNLAIAYRLAGMVDLAVDELQRVAEAQPDFADAHFELGLLHARSGRRDEALTALKRTLELEPTHPRAAKLMARLGKSEKPSAPE
jgi:Flp pilus assembly protein TadD